MKEIIGILVCMLLISATGVALADWKEGDGYKMHFPQLPDPVGWDVDFSNWALGDDWKCSENGPVTDVHFWISWRLNEIGQLPWIRVSIFSNNPQGPGGWSEPLEPLWNREFLSGQFIIAGPWQGDQGWFMPPSEYWQHDHINYYQINIKNITNPFNQTKGIIYWLVIQMPVVQPLSVGWKTSKDDFMDNAVWGMPGNWYPLEDPITQKPINFAFVITGKVPHPNLSCDGSLKWTSVKPGATVTGFFSVGNIGDPGSLLDWEVNSWPTWGTWTFSPSSGTGLLAGSWVTVGATCVAPTIASTPFTGDVKVWNKNDHTDNCTIPVSLTTPRYRMEIRLGLQQLFERMILQFPILRLLLLKIQ